MRLVLAGVGRLKAGPERELLDRFSGRARAIARSAGIVAVDLIDVDEGRGRTADERKREEGLSLGTKLPPGTHLVVLDERGDPQTSTAFAASIGRLRDQGAPSFTLAVGGPDGWDEQFRARAASRMAFGAATLPHQLVRVLAAEQIYRALTILTGHPYHRA